METRGTSSLAADRRCVNRALNEARAPLAARYPLEPVHVWPQRLGDHDAAVRLLVVLHDRDHGAADGKPAAVERVHEARLGLGLGPVADARAARLEVGAVGAGRDLAIGVL